ncbi:protein late bloomer [Drosophila ficusphila]|uniref:protein late bloomer n=1 Tax=Drosophila ficusphila TaxID=30025 RepID=UPI0007E7A836|nr:protein late bloomer [Drosophila ficusphila]
MGWSPLMIKYLAFLFNFLCAVLGIATVVINVLAIQEIASKDQLILCIYIAVGSIVFLLSFFGCFGAIKDSICVTWSYAICMLVMLIISIVLLFVFRMHFDDAYSLTKLKQTFAQQTNNYDAMADYQTQFQCCGINKLKDYGDASINVPSSCYDKNEVPYKDGCLSKMENLHEEVLKGPKMVGWMLMVIEIGAFTFTTILGVTLRNEQRRAAY